MREILRSNLHFKNFIDQPKEVCERLAASSINVFISAPCPGRVSRAVMTTFALVAGNIKSNLQDYADYF